MRKMILTSTGLENKNIEAKFLELVCKRASEIKVLFIPTAAIDDESEALIPFCKKELLDAGVLEQNIVYYNLDKPIKEDVICSFQAIYVCGGNSMYLMQRMSKCNFRVSLNSFLGHGGVYLGVSAGSIVATTGISNGLNLINCSLRVHAETGSPCGTLDTTFCPIVNLTNNQAILINDDNVSIFE